MAAIYIEKKENYNQNISVTISPIAVILFLLYSLRLTQCNNREKIEICVIFYKNDKWICQYNVTNKINKMQQHFHKTPKSFFLSLSLHPCTPTVHTCKIWICWLTNLRSNNFYRSSKHKFKQIAFKTCRLCTTWKLPRFVNFVCPSV